MTPKKKHRLTDVRCSEVSIVDKAAVGVDGRNFYLFKRDVPQRDTSDELDLLGRIQEGIDRLKKSDWDEYKFWQTHPESFLYEFTQATEEDEWAGNLIIKRKLSSRRIPEVDSQTGQPFGETKTHRYNFEKQVWEPKQLRRLNRD